MAERMPLGALIKFIFLTYEHSLNKSISPYGLTASQAHLLSHLHHNHDKTVYQKDLEKAMSLSHPTVIGLVSRLEEKGFVKTGVSENDKRYKRIEETEKALLVHQDIKAHLKETDENLVSCLSEDEKTELIRLLTKITDNSPCSKSIGCCKKGGNI